MARVIYEFAVLALYLVQRGCNERCGQGSPNTAHALWSTLDVTVEYVWSVFPAGRKTLEDAAGSVDLTEAQTAETLKAV